MNGREKWRMNRQQLAAVTLGLLVLLIVGICASRCGRGSDSVPAAIVVDTVYDDTIHRAAKPATEKRRRRKAAKKKPTQAQEPRRRNYLDEVVSRPERPVRHTEPDTLGR